MLLKAAVALLTGVAIVGVQPAGMSGGAAMMPGEEAEIELDPRDLVASLEVSLHDAIVAAERAVKGTAVEAEIEVFHGGQSFVIFYDVDILTKSGRLHDVLVSARTGKVEHTEAETDAEAAAEARAYRRVLRHSEKSLAELVESASGIVHGTPVAAGFETDEGPVCEVLVVNDRYLIEAEFETRAGHLIGLELENDWGDDDDGDED
jgi:hypothetical protein